MENVQVSAKPADHQCVVSFGLAMKIAYGARALRGDLFGGITAGIIALPLALPENIRQRLLNLGFDTLVGSEMMFRSYEDALYAARALSPMASATGKH